MEEKIVTDVHEDVRGIIRWCEAEGVEFNVLYTEEGALRSGDVHPHKQFDLVLQGEWKITLRQDGEDVVKRVGENDMIVIPADTPHLFEAVTDTVTIEWWDGEFESEYYEPYRKKVEAQFDG